MTVIFLGLVLMGWWPASDRQAPLPATPGQAPSSSTPGKTLPPEKQLRKTVSFIKVACEDDGSEVETRGTGFFVIFPDQRLGDQGGFIYLVTNRHVAECWNRNRQPRHVRSVNLTLNMREGGFREVRLGSGNVPWILPTDDSVDLAVLPLLPDQKAYDYFVISAADFVQDEDSLSEGDKIMFSGFFYQFSGVRKMQPIVREGILAMLPDEDLDTTAGKPGKVYLGDVHIFGGNSGSPVLVNVAGRGPLYSDSYRLLGVISGMFYEDTNFQLEVTTMLEGTMRANSGIAMIVPAKQLKTLLDDPRLQSLRDREVPIITKAKQDAQKQPRVGDAK